MKKEIQNKKQNLKTYKGITLIALVVTIVVLLILAAISITALFGEDGLITRANKAKIQTEDGAANDIAAIEGLNSRIDELVNGTTVGSTEEETDIFVTLYTDGSLVFSNNDSTISGKTVSQSFGNIRGQSFNVTRSRLFN